MLRAHQDRSVDPNTITVEEYSEASQDMGLPGHVIVDDDSTPGGVREAFHQDIFTELFQFNYKDNEQLTKNGEIVRDLREVCKGLPSFDDLKRRCTMDNFLSYIGAGAMSDEPLKALSNIMRRNKQESNDEANPLQDEANRSDMRQAAKRAVRAASDEVEFVQDVVSKGWGSEEADWTKVSLKERVDFFKKLRSGPIRKVLEDAGRWERLLTAKRKSREAAIAVADIELGSDLSRLLPSELSALKHPLRRAVFIRNFFEGRCLQYSLKDNEPKGKGPIVILSDQSSSMRHADLQAKGLILGMDAIMKKQGRPVIGVPFSSTVAEETLWYDGGRIDLFIEGFMRGGTDIFAAIKHAITVINERVRFEKADIVLVTDAECGFSLKEMDELRGLFSEENAPRLTSIVLGSWDAIQLAELGSVVHISDLAQSSMRDAIASELSKVTNPLGALSV